MNEHKSEGAEPAWRLLGQLKSELAVMSVIFILGASAVIAVVVQLPRLYTAEAVLLVDSRRNPLFETGSPLVALQADTNAVNSEVALLKVEDTLARVVDRLELTKDLRYVPSLEGEPEPKAGNWEALALGLATSVLNLVGIEQKAPIVGSQRLRQASAMERLSEGLKVVNDARTYALRVQYTASDPAHAALVANAVADTYVETQRDSRAQGVRARIVSKALVPVLPRRSRTVSAALGLALAAGLALGIGVARGRLHGGIRSGSEAENRFGLPILAMVPRAGRRSPSGDILRGKGRLVDGPGAALAANVLARGEAPRSVLVTSPGQGEGKSICALLLASGLARAGYRTLLTEAGPHQAAWLSGTEAAAPGLSDILAGEAFSAKWTPERGPSHLHVLPWGAHSLPPIQLFTLERWSAFKEKALAQFDFLIVDGPGLMVPGAAQILVPRVDQVLMVLRWYGTAGDSVERAAAIVERLGKQPELLLAQIDPRLMSRRERGYMETFL